MAQQSHGDHHDAAQRGDGKPDAGMAEPVRAADGPHALATGTGAGAGAAAGAAIGAALGGPAGAAVGATFGALGGGLAGQAVADAVDPAEEDTYWRNNYLSRPYADDTLSYDHYRPAYRYGWAAHGAPVDGSRAGAGARVAAEPGQLPAGVERGAAGGAGRMATD
jgi:phage tail tape-measure protein